MITICWPANWDDDKRYRWLVAHLEPQAQLALMAARLCETETDHIERRLEEIENRLDSFHVTI